MGRQAASASCRPCDCGLRAARGLTILGQVLSNAGFPASQRAATTTAKTQCSVKTDPFPGDLSPMNQVDFSTTADDKAQVKLS